MPLVYGSKKRYCSLLGDGISLCIVESMWQTLECKVLLDGEQTILSPGDEATGWETDES